LPPCLDASCRYGCCCCCCRDDVIDAAAAAAADAYFMLIIDFVYDAVFTRAATPYDAADADERRRHARAMRGMLMLRYKMLI